MHFVVLSKVFERSLADIHHHFKNLASERKWGFVEFRDRRAGIAADVEALIGGDIGGNLFFEAATPDCLLSEAKGDCATRAELAFLIDLHLSR